MIGLPKAPVRDIALVNCDFQGVADRSIVRHVEGLRLTNVRVNGRPATSL